MKLLFVENRYATRLYEAVAPALRAVGHEVHWMVQNPAFAPAGDGVHQLAFPRRADLGAPPSDPLFERLAQSDRAVRYFGRSNHHHAHYHRQVCELLDRVRPDVVFGESTQLHELLTIEESRRRGIDYLFPTSTRYPPSRLCFLREDGMEPVGGAGEPMSESEARAMIERINQRSLVPSYMSAPAGVSLAQRRRALGDKLRVTWSWVRGERYLTPSPWTKLRVDRAHRHAREQWAALAAARYGALTETPFVLYPLQMQPESTIDVWGLPWNDQADIVRRTATALAPHGVRLLVKPNPKPKYEIDDRLVAAVRAAPNAIPVPEGVSMSTLFGPAAAVLSVTGTVLIESVLAGKPAFTLGEHAMARYPGVTALSEPEQLGGRWKDGRWHSQGEIADAGYQLLQQLQCRSYGVRVPDPFNQPEALDDGTSAAMAKAFLDVLRVLPSDRQLSGTTA